MDIEDRFSELEARIARLEAPRKPIARQVAQRADALETTLGTYWLSRIGILSLITGAALLIITYFAQLGPFVRVGVGYTMAALLAWIGLRLARTHETLGRIVFGGGLAIAYFVTYALHFVASLRVIDNEVIGVALVAAVVAGIVATAHRMKSETVAGIALFLALHTGMLSEVTALSLIATTLLAAGAAFFLSFNRWVIVPLSTVVAVYSTHAVLAFGAAGVSPELRVAFVAVDFSLFASAVLLGPSLSPRPLALLSLLNWVGALVLGATALLEISDHVAFAGGCGLALAVVALALLARSRGAARELVALHLGLALITLALVVPLEAQDLLLVALWLALALVAMLASRLSDHRFGVLSLVLVVLASRVDTSTVALSACIATALIVERWHVIDKTYSRLRVIAIAAISLGMLDLSNALMPRGLLTLGWVIVAVVLFVLGFTLRVVAYRWAAFAVLVAAAVRLGSRELRYFSANQRILTFVGAGVAMLAISYVYNRRKPR
ncbi:hypothetical protein BH11MYX2_BH11MYX2_00270 [soil metagenome]